jgi:NAD(P)-dependent dehydrogenase (short-subunit alcohol dehydrogenase family)
VADRDDMSAPLAGRRAVVTGASSGIGAAIAVAFAEAGADVVGLHLHDGDNAHAVAGRIEALGRRAVMVDGDAGDSRVIDALATTAREELGGLDIWLNNAARMMVRPLLETSDDDWHGLLASNLHGYFYGCRAAARSMVESGAGGRIINMSSAARTQAVSEFSAYTAAKGAIMGLTRALAVELAPYGINVNAIAPGATDTPLNKDAYTPEVRRNYEQRIPLGHIASADEVAGTAVFLASDASSYLIGQEIVVDGGLTINGSVGHGRV